VADVFRSDLPGIVPPSVAWMTWVTNGRILPPNREYANDAVLLADPQWIKSALEAGWHVERVQIAAWPTIVPGRRQSRSALTNIGLFADTRTIEVPKRIREFSSQLLLWEMIQEELSAEPLSLGADPLRYLQTRMDKFKIADEGLDRAMFFEQLIFPAYHQGLARMLIRRKRVPCLAGAGWLELPEFNRYAVGPIATTEDLLAAVSRCDALIHPFPDKPANMYDSLGLPVIQPSNTLTPAPSRPQIAPLSRGRVLSAIPSMNWPPPNPADPPRSVD
jgi:hypothetical protein